MGAIHKVVLNGLSEPQLTNAMYEMSTRVASMADRRGVAKVKGELAEEKRTTAALREELEALRTVHEEIEKC